MSGWLDARNLLAVRLDNAGDVIMLGPALQAVKENSPGAKLTLLATLAGKAASALLPSVDDVIVWQPVWQDISGKAWDPAGDRDLIAILAAQHFDGAMIFTSFSQTPHVPGYVCYLAGIPRRAGESKEFGGATLTDELSGAPDELHQAERNLRLVEHLGFAVRDRHLQIAIPDAARERVTALLRGLGLQPGEPFVLIHPGASARARRLPADRLIGAIRLLRAWGISLIVSGSEREVGLVTAIGEAAEVPVLAGQTTLPELAALVAAACVVVCGNTLPLHLADAVGTPLVVLYSGTDLVSQWQPRVALHHILRRETVCTPCYRFDCPIGQVCLDITPDEITAAVLEVALTRPLRGHLPPSQASLPSAFGISPPVKGSLHRREESLPMLEEGTNEKKSPSPGIGRAAARRARVRTPSRGAL